MIVPNRNNYYHTETQREYITNSQIGVYLLCQLQWWKQFRELTYTPFREKACFLLGHLVETLLLRPDTSEAFYEENKDELFNKVTSEQIRTNLTLQPKSVQDVIKERFPALYSTRGVTKGQLKGSISITEEMEQLFPQLFAINGPMKKDFEVAHEMVQAVHRQPALLPYLEGRQEVALTGEIGGVKVMGLLDLLNAYGDVDIKTTAFMDELKWCDSLGRKVPFYEVREYWRQRSMYRELITQNLPSLEPILLPLGSSIIAISTPTKSYRISKARRFEFNDPDRFSYELAMIKATVMAMNVTDADNAIGCGVCECCASLVVDEPVEALDWRQA